MTAALAPVETIVIGGVRRPIVGYLGDGHPIVEALADMLWYVTAIDIECAVPFDFTACAIAKAVERQIGVPGTGAIIGRQIAYVKMPADDGTPVWNRFRVPEYTRDKIDHFDETNDADPGGYLLKAPSERQTVSAQRERANAPKAATNTSTAYRNVPSRKIRVGRVHRNSSGVVQIYTEPPTRLKRGEWGK